MATTIDAGFREFLGTLTPSTTESNAAISHRASIEACLRANYRVLHYFRSGSFGHGTSISGYSDVDYIASFERSEISGNSAYFLSKVRNTLNDRFPNTGVKVDCPAIHLPFGRDGSESTEVVPADYILTDANKYKVFEIADCDGGWIRSSPDAHGAYVDSQNNNLDKKVKPLIRLMKAWKFYRNAPIGSFYLEMRTAKYASAENAIVYSIDLARITRWLCDNLLPSLQDPMGVSGLINPCKTESNRIDAISKLATAANRAEKALEFERLGMIAHSFEQWGLFFDGKFPTYG